MTCQACTNPRSGHYTSGCRQCTLRSLARSPEFYASMKACKLTPAYMALLQALGPVESVHAEVKAVAEALSSRTTTPQAEGVQS